MSALRGRDGVRRTRGVRRGYRVVRGGLRGPRGLLGLGQGGYGLEDGAAVGEAIDAIEHQAMKMNVEIRRGAKPLDVSHRAGVGLGPCQLGVCDRKGRESAVDDLQQKLSLEFPMSHFLGEYVYHSYFNKIHLRCHPACWGEVH